MHGSKTCILLISGLACFLLQSCKQTPESIYQKVNVSIYQLANFDILEGRASNAITGSAVAVSNKILATNCHVALRSKYNAVIIGKKGYYARPIDVNHSQDVCLLYVANLTLNPVKIRATNSVNVGEKVFAIGFPRISRSLGENYFSDGIVSSKVIKNKNTWLYTNTTVSFGSSGGGLFDARGRLIGIITAMQRNIALVASTEWLVTQLDKPIESHTLEIPRDEAVSPPDKSIAPADKKPELPQPPQKTPESAPKQPIEPSTPATPSTPVFMNAIGKFGSGPLALYKVGDKCFIYFPGKDAQGRTRSAAFWTPNDAGTMVVIPQAKTAEEGALVIRGLLRTSNKGGKPQLTQNTLQLNTQSYPMLGGDPQGTDFPLLVTHFGADPTALLTSNNELIFYYKSTLTGEKITFDLSGFSDALEKFKTSCPSRLDL